MTTVVLPRAKYWNLPRRIALGGLMGSGKTTTAGLLVEQGYTPLAFADEIRRWLEPAHGTIEKGTFYPITDARGEPGFMTGRELLQRYGAAARAIDLDIIIRAMRATIDDLDRRNADARLVIHDLRTPREAEMLKVAGFEVVILQAPETTRKERTGNAWSDRYDLTESPLVGYPSIRTDARTPVQVLDDIAAALRGNTWQG
jgi:dephospho-CoA kinase